MSYQRSGPPKDGRRRYSRYPNHRAYRYGGYSPVPTRNYKDISYVGNVGDRAAVGDWGLPPIAQSYDHRPLHQHGGGTRGQARVDSSSSSHSRAGDKKSQATDEADDKHQRGYRKSSEKQRSGSSHHDWTSSHEDLANSRDAHTSFRDSHAHGDKISFPDSHSRDGDGKKSSRQKSDGDRKAGKLSRLNLDVVLQDEQLTNLLFAGISKATAKLDQSLKTTDTKLENYASIDDSASRDKAQQSVQTSSAEGPQKPKSILKLNTREERVDVESKVSTESQVSSDSFSKLSALEKTLHLLRSKTNVEDVVRGSGKGSRGSEKPSFKPVGALSQLESYNDSGDDYDHAEKDTKKQTKTKKNAPSSQPFWSKMDQLSQQTGQTPNLALFSQAKKAGDNNEEELDSTVQNILQSIGFNFDLSKRPQEFARRKEQQDVLHTGMINQSASFLGQSNRLVKGVRAAVFSDKQKKAQPDSLNKETRASMQNRPDYERSASGDTFSADTQSGKSSYSRKGKNPEPDIDRSRMGLGSHEIRSDRRLENLQNIDWEQISPHENEMDGIESRQIIKKMKTLPHEKHAEVRQRSCSKERDVALSQKSKDLLRGSHEKSLRPSERYRDEPKNEYIYQDVSKSITIKAAALLAALCSKQKEVSSSGSKSLKLPLQSGSAQVENPRVTSRTVHSDDNKNDEPYIESRKMSLPSKSDVRIVSQSPVFRKSQSPEMKVPRKRPASPLPCPVSKEKEDRVLNEKRSFSVLQAFLKTSFEKSAPGFCQAPGLNVDSCDKLPLLQTLLGGLNVGGLPAAESTRSPVMSDHFDRDSVRKSPDRPTLISPDVRTSRSPGMSRSPERRKAGLPDVPMSRAPSRPKSRSPDKRKSVSPDKRKSTSLDRHLSRSPERRSSRLPDKMKSKSPNRQMSRSPVKRKSILPGRRVSKSANRQKSIASSRRTSRSPDRHRSRSPDRRRSRSPDRHKSRSPDRHRSRSPGRHRSRSPCRHRSRSSDRHRSRSPYRRRSRSLYRRRSRSPGKHGSRSPKRPRVTSVKRSKSRSPYRLKARSPARYKSKSPGRYRSQSTSRRRSSSPGQRRIRSPSVLPSQAISPLNQQMLSAGQQNLPPQVQTFNAIPPVNQQMWPVQQQNLPPQVQTFNAIPPVNQQMWPVQQQNLPPQVQTFNAIPPVNQQMWPAQQQNLPPQVQTFNAIPPDNQQMWPAQQQNLPPQVQTFNAIPPDNQQMWPAQQQNLPPQVQTFNAIPPLNQQMLPTGQQNFAPQVQTSYAIPPLNQQMPTGQQNFTPQVQTFNAIPPLNQQMLPTGQQNFAPQVQTSHAITPLNQQMWSAGQQNFAPQVQTSHAIPPLNQQMLPTGQQNFAPQVQTSHAIPPLNQQMPTGQQNFAPQVQTSHAIPPLNQQMPTGQQNFAPQVQTSHAIPPLNQQMLPTGQQNLVPQVQTSHAIPPLNQQMWPAGQQNFAPRTAAPNWPAAQNWQLPQYHRQNVYRDTNTTIINTYNMIVLPAQENIPTMYEEDWEELPAAQSKELSEEQKKEPLKEQPKEQVQELPNVQEKEPEKEQEQQNQDLSKSATKNDTKLEVDIFGEFPVYERKIIFKNMALMNTAERQKLAQDLSETQTKLAELKAEMAKLVKEQNEIMHRTDVVNANLPELTQNKKAQANLTEEVGRLLKASNYIPEKTQVSGERQFMIPKLKTPQIKKQKPLVTGNSRVAAKRQKLKGKLTGSTKPWLSKSSNQNMATVSPDDYPLREDHKDTNTRLPVIESVTLNGFITTCLYDTALQFDAIVATSLVNPDQVTDEIIKIQGPVKGSVPLSLPVAKVKIISHYVTGEIRAAVLDDPIYPVMLGCRYVFLRDPVHPMIASAMTTGQQAMKDPSSTPTNPQPEEFKQAQAADSTLAACFHKLRRTHTPPYTGQMYMKNGLLHKRTGKKGQEHAQLIVPSSYRVKILDMGHILSFNGHMDISATMERISAHYFWPGMNPDIVRYVKSCPQCQRVAPKNLVAASTLGQMRFPHTPFEKVALDIVGPFKRTERRNCYILTLVDTFSMWAEIVPMPSSNSKHVAKALLSIFTRLGFPLRILTDNRSQFRGKLMEEVFRLFQSRQIHTSPYYPVSSGNLKQFNGTLFSILRTLAHEQPETWDTYVPAALFAYREVPHDSTGIAPAILLFRRPIKGLLEALLRTWTDDQVDETIVTAPTYVAELNRLQYGWKLASDNLQKARHKIGRCHNKKNRELEVGEKVLLLLSASQNKLQIGWKGPYEVIDKISRNNYRISILGKQKIFHINLLRKYNERLTTETAHLMTLAEAIEVDHGITMGVEYPLQAKETYVDVDISPALTQDQQQQIQDLLASYAEILTDKPGLTDLVEFDIKLNDPTPVQVKTYPVPYAKATALKDEIQQMLSSGIISPSESPYSASVVLLRKPCGEHKLCIDYRQLNAITEFQAEPLPDQSQLFTILSRAKYFTRIDISKGYYQIPVKPEVRPWLAFSTPDGHYEFNVVPFGLSNTPSVFTRMMRKLLEPLHHSAISNFMDDILIATETFEEHSKALHLFFKRLKETGLTARPKKCQIGFQQLDFLGHTISQGFMTPLEGNIEKLQQAPCPRTKKDVTSFVSLCGCYQRYIKDFSSLTAPLTNLTRKEEPETVIWSAECDEAYSALKKALTAEPVLHLPDLKQPFILRTDASNIGIGATLLQRKEDEHSLLFPVAYASRKLNTAERNYSTIEKECLALVWAVEKFQAYLYGKHFTVQFDHQPLMFLAASGDLNARLMRWSLLLQPYSFQIEYIPGKSNVGADFLSRHPVPDTVTETKEKGNQEEEMDYI